MSPHRLLSAVVLSTLLLAGCASTHRVMLAPPRAPIAVEQVKIYHVAPKRFEEIARLESSSAIGFGTPGQTEAAIQRLRREAAKLGANGVLLLGVGSVAPPVSVGVGTGVHRSHVGIYGGVGIPTTQRQAAGVAIHVIED